ncbi:MAG: ribonuclease Z [Elusimicrobiota bacterium]
MDFIVLGSGSLCAALGKNARNPAGYALVLKRETLLFDLGFGALTQLARSGTPPESVSRVFLSHRHPDHVGDLPALLFRYRYAEPRRTALLRLYGPRGFRGFFERLRRAHHPWLNPRGYRIELEELEGGAVVRGPGWAVRCREVPHSTQALAFRFDSSEGSLCYSGDTGFDGGLAGFARGTGLFAVECSLDKERSDLAHLSAAQALALGRASGAKRVLLTHLTRESERTLSRMRLRRNERKASDLLRVRL